jgi:hypothetical protein
MKVEFVPSVAELPTCQKMLHACAPFTMVIVLALDVITVETALMMKTADGSPSASNVRFVELDKLEPDAYVPALRVCPPRSKFVSVTAVGILRSLYAVVKSVCAIEAALFVILVVPPMVIVPVFV